MVQLLIDRGAKIPPDATKAAASYGHLEIARLLLSHDAHIEGALVAAARSGYGDIVRLLLEHGANPNEEHGGLPAMGHASLAEHATMIRDVREYGARPLTDAGQVICLEEAQKVSMDLRFVLRDS
jgi:ankyrin repeat protein